MNLERVYQTRLSRHGFSVGLLAVFVAVVLLGLAHSRDYGMAWDDPGDAAYGADSLRAYVGSPSFLAHGDRSYYGPAYFMASSLASQIGQLVAPGWLAVDIRHAVNFITFQAAIVAFFVICRGLVSRRASILAALLFELQPTIFGHAFINEKDVPFMAAFCVAVAAGIVSVDRIRGRVSVPPGDPRRAGTALPTAGAVIYHWKMLSRETRIKTIILAVLATAMGWLVLSDSLFLPWLLRLLDAAYTHSAWPPLQALFDRLAQDAYKTPVTLYAAKVRLVYAWARMPLALVFGVPLVLHVGRLLHGWDPSMSATVGSSLLWIGSAGVAVGLATSIRVAGPFAGLLVAGYAISKLKATALPYAILYGLTGTLACILTWPYLWNDPIGGAVQSLKIMASFRSIQVLYQGQLLTSKTVPATFLVHMLAIKMTLAAIVLGVFGMALGIRRALTIRSGRTLLIMSGVWLLLPLTSQIIFGVPEISDPRQMFFVLPPVFIAVALALEAILKCVTSSWLAFALASLVLVPSVIGIVRLHPYEYAYYNSLVGGVNGAAGEYGLDYWCTSYREAMAYINSHAEKSATVVVWGPDTSARPFARADLKMLADYQAIPDPDWVLACNVGVQPGQFYGAYEDVWQVHRGEAVLAVVKRPASRGTAPPSQSVFLIADTINRRPETHIPTRSELSLPPRTTTPR